jgi:hypothetical protein
VLLVASCLLLPESALQQQQQQQQLAQFALTVWQRVLLVLSSHTLRRMVG